MDSCVNEFLEFLSVEKGASGNTIAAYRNDLSQLEEYFGARKNGHIAIQWPGLVQNQVLDYILFLKGQSYAEATVARKVAAVKSFLLALVASPLRAARSVAFRAGQDIFPQVYGPYWKKV